MKKSQENDLVQRKKQLAEWIRKGWRNKELDTFILSTPTTGCMLRYHIAFLIIEHEKYQIVIRTLGFAAVGKLGSVRKAMDTLYEEVAGTSDPFQVIANFFGMPRSFLAKLGHLDGVYARKTPLEIADMLERGEI